MQSLEKPLKETLLCSKTPHLSSLDGTSPKPFKDIFFFFVLGRKYDYDFFVDYGTKYLPLLLIKNLTIWNSWTCIYVNIVLQCWYQNVQVYVHWIIQDKLTVNSVTWIELPIGSKSPAALYISRTKATQDVDFPSLYNQSSCSGIINSSSKDDPRLSVSTKISGRLRFCMEHVKDQIMFTMESNKLPKWSKKRKILLLFILPMQLEMISLACLPDIKCKSLIIIEEMDD